MRQLDDLLENWLDLKKEEDDLAFLRLLYFRRDKQI